MIARVFTSILVTFSKNHWSKNPVQNKRSVQSNRLFHLSFVTNTFNMCLFVPLCLLTSLCPCAGGVGLPALSVEEDPGGHRCCLLWGSPAAAALLAARVGRQEHLHTHTAEGRTHAAAQDHSTCFPLTHFSLVLLYLSHLSLQYL